MDQECTAREQEEKAVSSVSFRMYSTHSTQYVHMHCSNVHTGLQFICTYRLTIHMYIAQHGHPSIQHPRNGSETSGMKVSQQNTRIPKLCQSHDCKSTQDPHWKERKGQATRHAPEGRGGKATGLYFDVLTCWCLDFEQGCIVTGCLDISCCFTA